MLTIPTALWPYLVSQNYGFAEVYEIEPIDTQRAAEKLTDGGFETWSSPTNLTNWTEAGVPGFGSWDRESSVVKAGTYCAKFTRTGVGYVDLYQTTAALVPGGWYRYEFWSKTSASITNGFILWIRNETKNKDLNSSGAWVAPSQWALAANTTTEWQRYAVWFRVDPTFDATDQYNVYCPQTNIGVGQSSYRDAGSLFGPYDRPALYYSSQDVTWNGNAYSGLATRRGKITESMEFRIPDCAVTLSNVTNVLRSYLDPLDTLTGARMTVRLLVKDSGGVTLPDSFVRFVGRIEPPKQVSEDEFSLSAVGLLDGVGVDAPSRRMSLLCRWPFANGGLFDGNGDCSYTSNTTANGAGTATTALVLTRQPSTTTNGAGFGSTALTLTAASTFANEDTILIDGQSNRIASGGGTVNITLAFPCTWLTGKSVTWAGNFKNGDTIQVGGGEAVVISSGGGTVNVTLASARTWSNGATVRFATCPNRSRAECEARNMLHRFGGHPGVASTSRLRNKLNFNQSVRFAPANPSPPRGRLPRHKNPGSSVKVNKGSAFSGIKIRGDAFVSTSDALWVVFGRRRSEFPAVELIAGQTVHNGMGQRWSFHSLGVGEIDSVVEWYRESVLGIDLYPTGIQEKEHGIYYRVGSSGLNDLESVADYAASHITRPRSQNIDYRSFAGIAYHREAYVILLYLGLDTSTDPDFAADVKGVKLQKYDSTGAASGSRVWTPSPIWQLVEWATADYAINLDVADVDTATAATEAAYAEELISSTEASTTVRAISTSTRCYVKSTEGFILGRRVDINGVARTVVAIVDDGELTLSASIVQAIGHTVIQRPERFESHHIISDVRRGSEHLQPILDACRGYVTYDNGRVQFRIERNHVQSLIANGDFESWASATDASDWTETIGGASTVNRESSIVYGGTYSCRLVRVASGNLWLSQSLGSLEPGRWYRLTYRTYSDNAANKLRASVRNNTQGKDVLTDGITWQALTQYSVNDTAGVSAWKQHELSFLVDPSFGASDSYTLWFFADAQVAYTVYVDDVTLRGPYAGDFRETTGSTIMGWKEGSFKWSLDSKDRETNRVVVRFVNESAQFGDDEVEVNDFDHQASHVMKTKTYDIPAIADRDQAGRMAQFLLEKHRTLGHGCEFIGTPAALAIQPGDVILVSHTVPNWETKEQRVVEVSVVGTPDKDEHFVHVKTEWYDDTIYSDVGPIRGILPPRPDQSITVTVTRNTGGILDLTWTTAAGAVAVQEYRVYQSSVAGFTPSANSLLGRATQSSFSYTARTDEIEQVRYYVVSAVSDYGETLSAQFQAVIYAVDYDATDGTHGENNASGNMVYDSDFNGTEFTDGTTKNGDGWLTNTVQTLTIVQANSHTTPSGSYGVDANIAFTSPASAYDANNTTYAVGTAAWSSLSPTHRVASMSTGFPTATRTGRGKIRGKVSSTGGTVTLWYSTNGGTNYTQFATATSTLDVDYYTPRFTSQAMASFRLEVRCTPRQSTPNNSATFNWAEATFEDDSAGSIIAHCGAGAGGRCELKGNGGSNYAEVRRRFPDKSPPANGIYLTTTTPNRWEIKAQRLTASAPTLPLQIVIQDAASGTSWTVASIAAADIAAGWTAFTGLFDPGGTPVSGTLDIVIRTADTNGIRCDQVSITRELVISGYQVSGADQALGRFPDLSIGEATNWPKGKLTVAGGYRKVTL